ncbi:MAG TPA: flagellar hook-basal body protein [Tepidisphaeraceae bacterium]|jgi:flagellar basal body rod protein FlgG|nr:flagellar hook-basal body protein [Tepidisphaeraceae bacterium]
MLYGMYLSASGVMANSHRQDVIANNLANSETVGFKRDLALFMERLPESQSGQRPGAYSDPMLDKITGGLLIAPSSIDTSAGELETTDAPLDVAIMGEGYFSVKTGGKQHLTRDGRLMVDREGHLIQAGSGAKVLDVEGQPIDLDPARLTTIATDGAVTQDGETIARLGIFEITDRSQIMKTGGNMIRVADNAVLKPAAPELRIGMLERANVDPASELSALMECQRELEANANLIRYQDQSLGRLINEVGKVG